MPTTIEALASVEDIDGLLIDALVLLIADANARKGANPESTSDVRVTEAEALIRWLADAPPTVAALLADAEAYRRYLAGKVVVVYETEDAQVRAEEDAEVGRRIREWVEDDGSIVKSVHIEGGAGGHIKVEVWDTNTGDQHAQAPTLPAAIEAAMEGEG